MIIPLWFLKFLVGGKKLTGWGKNGPAYFFPGERMGRPILSPGKNWLGGNYGLLHRLAWYLTIGHACWSVATATNILLVECRWKKVGYNSVATLTEAWLHQTWLLILCHSQICLLVQSTLLDMHAGLIYSDTCVCKVLLHQARHLVCYKSTRHAYR